MKRSIFSIVATLLLIVMCFNLTSCKTIKGWFGIDDEQAKSEKSSTSTIPKETGPRDLEKTDISVRADDMIVNGAKENNISSMEFATKIRGNLGYVYIDCKVRVIWKYKIMDAEGNYQDETTYIDIELDRLGNGTGSKSLASQGYSAKQLEKSYEILEGTISAK